MNRVKQGIYSTFTVGDYSVRVTVEDCGLTAQATVVEISKFGNSGYTYMQKTISNLEVCRIVHQLWVVATKGLSNILELDSKCLEISRWIKTNLDLDVSVNIGVFDNDELVHMPHVVITTKNNEKIRVIKPDVLDVCKTVFGWYNGIALPSDYNKIVKSLSKILGSDLATKNALLKRYAEGQVHRQKIIDRINGEFHYLTELRVKISRKQNCALKADLKSDLTDMLNDLTIDDYNVGVCVNNIDDYFDRIRELRLSLGKKSPISESDMLFYREYLKIPFDIKKLHTFPQTYALERAIIKCIG